MKFKIALFSVALLVIVATVDVSQTGMPGGIHAADDAIPIELRKEGIKYETKRAIVWVEKGGLTQKEIEEFGKLVNKGIINIETYTGTKFDKKHYQADKVEYFISSKTGLSHGSVMNEPFIYMRPALVK